MPTLCTITVNWNSGSQLQQALDSLSDVADEVDIAEVWVADNASTDGSADNLEAAQLPLHIIRNQSNLGFAAACNQAAERSSADVLLFLNPDTLQRPGALAAGIRGLSDPQVGAVGIRLVSESGTPRTCCRRLTLSRLLADSLKLDRIWPQCGFRMGDFDHESSRHVGHVIGAYYFIERDLFLRLGGFDERFFVYFEDYDLSTRVDQSGYSVSYDAAAVAFHRCGGTSDQIKATRLYYSLLSRLQLAAKYFGLPGLLAASATMVAGELPLRLARAAASLRLSELGEILGGYGMLISRGPAAWHDGRRRIAAQRARNGSAAPFSHADERHSVAA